MGLSIERSLESALDGILSNETFIKANSISVRSANTNEEMSERQVVVKASELANMNFSSTGGGPLWRCTLDAVAVCYRASDSDKDKLDDLHEAILGVFAALTPASLNAVLTGLRVDGVTNIQTVEHSEERFRVRGVSAQIFLKVTT